LIARGATFMGAEDGATAVAETDCMAPDRARQLSEKDQGGIKVHTETNSKKRDTASGGPVCCSVLRTLDVSSLHVYLDSRQDFYQQS
jgi:hypothetical protein